MHSFSRIHLLGIDIDRVSAEDVLNQVEKWVEARIPARLIATPNADFVMNARRDEEFRGILDRADLALPDGMAVVYASRLLRRPLAGTVSGRLLVPRIAALAARRGWSLFLLGGQPGAAEATERVLRATYPGLTIAGTFCPRMGFSIGDDEDRRAVESVRKAAPEVLFVALGSPKQEKWIDAHLEQMGVPVSMGVGYAFDVVGGLVPPPPVWMNRVGLEWLFRMFIEPRRLWRRYLLRGAVFVSLVLRERWRMRH
jgi:N-acetylglucosaminyldiphosphoundecaprenol N-acetyl-beta-D-mannosaminyltransferase